MLFFLIFSRRDFEARSKQFPANGKLVRDMASVKARALLRRQLITMDGCGPELLSMMKIIEDDDLMGVLPPNTSM